MDWYGEVNMGEQDVMVQFLHPHGPQKISSGPETLTDVLYQCKQYFIHHMKLFLIPCHLLLLEMLNLEIFVAESSKNFQLI